jgi:hypothetical protein
VSRLRSIERWSRVAPLGVRFVDDQGGRFVAEGMVVKSWPTQEPSRIRPMPRNGGDAFYLIDAPGLRDIEFGAGDDDYWSGLARQLAFTVEVEDLQRRFLPFRFGVEVPHRGLLRLSCGSPQTSVTLVPGAGPDGVPLFTAPARATTPGTVVLRADLWDVARHVPAAWAMLEARTPGARLRGEPPVRALADHRGNIALHFPVPDELDFDGGAFDSPATPGHAALSDRTWTVELHAFYGAIAAAPDTHDVPEPPIPDLCAVLAQPPTRLWDRRGLAHVELTQVTVRYGRECSLRSSDVGNEPKAVLLVTPSP